MMTRRPCNAAKIRRSVRIPGELRPRSIQDNEPSSTPDRRTSSLRDIPRELRTRAICCPIFSVWFARQGLELRRLILAFPLARVVFLCSRELSCSLRARENHHCGALRAFCSLSASARLQLKSAKYARPAPSKSQLFGIGMAAASLLPLPPKSCERRFFTAPFSRGRARDGPKNFRLRYVYTPDAFTAGRISFEIVPEWLRRCREVKAPVIGSLAVFVHRRPQSGQQLALRAFTRFAPRRSALSSARCSGEQNFR
jgi:hypothetical protein